MNFRPTPSEERWRLLARRLRRDTKNGPFAERTGGWRVTSFLSRCAFFVLGLVAVMMLGVIMIPTGEQGGVLVTGIVAVIIGEWLVFGGRHFASGIEEAFCVAGLSLLALWCAMETKDSNPLIAACFGVALVLAGMRMLNPLFTTAAAVAFVVALDQPPVTSGMLCFAIALAALVAGGRQFSRPSHDSMLDALVVIMPVAGYVWSASATGVSAGEGLSAGKDYLHAPISAWIVPLAPLAFAGVALALGFLRRVHAPILAFMLCVACTAFELRSLTGLSIEVRLVVWGSVLLIAAVALDRYLATPRSGFTSRALPGSEGSAAVLNLVGGAVLTPVAGAKAEATFEGGGGTFGGGGSSGQF
jgi:hypothetical protein